MYLSHQGSDLMLSGSHFIGCIEFCCETFSRCNCRGRVNQGYDGGWVKGRLR